MFNILHVKDALLKRARICQVCGSDYQAVYRTATRESICNSCEDWHIDIIRSESFDRLARAWDKRLEERLRFSA
jgi:hypothetical protein